MPLTKPLSDLKKDLKELLESDPGKALKYLQDLLPDGSDKHNQIVLLGTKLAQANNAYQGGRIDFKEQQMSIANVSYALVQLTNDLLESDFERKLVPNGQSTVAAVPKFVVICAQEDESHAKMLNRHLNVLKIMKKIRVYNVYEAEGKALAARAKEEMADSDFLLVLITVNLFNSEWFEIVYNALGENRRMIPIRIENADFEGTGLEKFRSLPSMGKAVSDFANADAAYADIVGELKKLLPK